MRPPQIRPSSQPWSSSRSNDTTAGWFHDPGSGTRSPDQTDKERRTALRYLGMDDPAHAEAASRDIHWEMIRMVLMSVANVAIIPAQDLLGLGSDARMNRPGTDRGNWAFRLAPGALTPAVGDRLRALCVTYDRVRAAA